MVHPELKKNPYQMLVNTVEPERNVNHVKRHFSGDGHDHL